MSLSLSEMLAWLDRYLGSALVLGRTDPILRSVDALALECYEAGEVRLGVMVAWLSVIHTVGLLAPAMAVLVDFLARRPALREACLPRGWPEPPHDGRKGRDR